LRHMKLIKKEDYKKLATDLKEFEVVSNLMVNFPPICMQDPLDVRTRSGMSAESSQPQLAQPSIPKKKRKHVVRKLKVASEEEEEEVEEAIVLVTRELKKKKSVDAAALKKALEIAKKIEVLAEVLLKESTVEAAQLGIEHIENL